MNAGQTQRAAPISALQPSTSSKEGGLLEGGRGVKKHMPEGDGRVGRGPLDRVERGAWGWGPIGGQWALRSAG